MIKKSRRLNLVLLFLAVAVLLVTSFVFIFEIGTHAIGWQLIFRNASPRFSA